MSKYARYTKVPVSQSKSEIEETLRRYGADSFGYANQPGRIALVFRVKGRMVRFTLAIPDPEKQAQAYRQRWRALLLTIKAKLEAVSSGIEEFDEAFMAQIVLPDGKTMAEYALPQVKEAYATGKMPPLLGFGP